MKNMKRILAMIVAAVMVLAMSLTAMAATGTITITPPSDIDASAQNEYKIYKVFDALGDGNGTGEGAKIRYTVISTKSGVPDVSDQMESGYDPATVDHFIVDSGDNVHYGTETTVDGKTVITDSTATELSEAAIKAIAAYVDGDEPAATATSIGAANAVSSALENGFYFIKTSTGTAVTIDSTNPSATVIDKNTVPVLDKKITGASSYDEDGKKALAQVGTDVEFTVTITVGKGARNYVFHDVMDEGLAYNGDAAVTITGEDYTPGGNDYTILAEPLAGDTFTITFVDDIPEGTVITITYSAKVTSAALQDDPANNTAKITYGEKNASASDATKVYNAKFTVTKLDEEEAPLANAGFVIKNSDGQYYSIASASDAEGANDTAGEGDVVTWVDSIEDASEFMSDAEGVVPDFTGLADGTYTLVEKTVPAGYNRAEDIEFTIEAGDYTADNLKQEAVVMNKPGVVLPSTGGTGTTIFYIIGSILVIGAGIVLVAKRRMGEK